MFPLDFLYVRKHTVNNGRATLDYLPGLTAAAPNPQNHKCKLELRASIHVLIQSRLLMLSGKTVTIASRDAGKVTKPYDGTAG